MAFLEVHQSLRDHRKVLALASELDMLEPHVVGHLSYLWLWSIDNAPDGILPPTVRIIERAAGWAGTPGSFVAACITAGFIDVQEDGALLIHDWWDYVGKLIEKRKSDAERKKLARSQSGRLTDVQRTSGGHPTDGAGTLHYTTQHYLHINKRYLSTNICRNEGSDVRLG